MLGTFCKKVVRYFPKDILRVRVLFCRRINAKTYQKRWFRHYEFRTVAPYNFDDMAQIAFFFKLKGAAPSRNMAHSG